jgi:ribosomal protein S18 acetylase RimI-like enzyme
MEVTIRNARETDAEFLAWVMIAAARSHVERGYWDFTFPGDEEKGLELIGKLATAGFKSICNFEGFLVAEVEGKKAAALSGYEPEKATDSVFVEMLNDVLSKEGWEKKDLGDMFNRIGPFLTCTPKFHKDAWVVEWVAALPEYRRYGLVSGLLEEIFQKGRDLGYKKSQIGVLIGNTPARRAYEKAGFKFLDEKRHPDFEATIKCPGIARLERLL